MAGHIIGSPYERSNCRGTGFPRFGPESTYRTDTVLIVATTNDARDRPRDVTACAPPSLTFLSPANR
jgi:hypothetical protein